jgi:hypothetical protein
MREFCNLAAGNIKRFILDNSPDKSDATIGLPKSEPTYDRGAAALKEVMEANFTDSWVYRLGDAELMCFSSGKVFDWKALDFLSTSDLSSVVISDGGEINFL